MRLKDAVLADLRFQWRQGIFAVYILITLAYMLILYQIPIEYRPIVTAIIVYSDPAIVGFFFIGGIVMLEKIQGVTTYLSVTPLKPREYLLAKTISLGILGIFAGFLIMIVILGLQFNFLLLFLGIILSSMFFTLYGFFVVAACRTINEYFLEMVPYMLLIVLPCLLIIPFPNLFILNILPPIAGIKLFLGSVIGIHIIEALFCVVVLIIANIIILRFVERVYEEKIANEVESI